MQCVSTAIILRRHAAFGLTREPFRLRLDLQQRPG